MNERIGDLMYRAGLTAQGCWDEMDAYDRKAIMTLAELIVQECATVAYNKQYKHSAAHTRGDCAEAIKKHFGVEE
jgi:hypothetical protein